MKAFTASLTLAAAASMMAPPSLAKPVTLNFAAEINGAPLGCDRSYSGVGLTGADLRLQDFRIYVSEVRLISADGREVPVILTPDDVWQDETVALLDFEDASGNCNGNGPTHTSIKGEAPEGTYTGVVFRIGVPESQNHQDPTLAPPPLNVSATAWVWRFGYKFTTIDLETAPAPGRSGTATGFSVHLGSTGCGEGSMMRPPEVSCLYPNRPEYRLTQFDPSTQSLVMDLGRLLADTDITSNAARSASGCMSGETDDDCVAIMDHFGLTYRDVPSKGQTFISVR